MDSWTEQLVTCPYNPAHNLQPKRFILHIHRCRKTASNAHEFDICPYTNGHHVKKSHMAEHVKTCPEKVTVEKMLIVEPKDQVIPKTFPKVADTYDASENWDDEILVSSYDPQKKIQSSMITATPQGLTKAARKQYVVTERHRLNVLREKGLGNPAFPQIHSAPQLQEPAPKPAFRPPQSEGPKSRIAANFFNVGNAACTVAPAASAVASDSNSHIFGRGRIANVRPPPGFASFEFPSVSDSSSRVSLGRGRGRV